MASVWKLPVVFLLREQPVRPVDAHVTDVAVHRSAREARGELRMPGETIDGNDVVAVYDAVDAARRPRPRRRGPKPDRGDHLALGRSFHARQPAGLPRRRRGARVAREPRRHPPHRRPAAGAPDRRRASLDAHPREGRGTRSSRRWKSPRPRRSRPWPYSRMRSPRRMHRYPPEPGPAHASARELSYRRGDQRGDRPGDGARPARVRAGRGRGQDRRHLRRHARADREVRQGAACATRRSRRWRSPARAVGAAITGMRPVAEIQIFDFITHMMDTIVNQAAKFRYHAGRRADGAGGVSRPAGRRHPPGRAAFAIAGGVVRHVPGLVVMAPSTPYDAKGLLAARSATTTRSSSSSTSCSTCSPRAPVPDDRVRDSDRQGGHQAARQGRDAGRDHGDGRAGAARGRAACSREGIDVEVIDPRTLRPLDNETIIDQRQEDGPTGRRA